MHISIKDKDKRFTKFINKNKKCLKQVVQLFDEKLEQKIQDDYRTLGKNSADE